MDNPPPSFSRLSFLAGFGFGAFIGGALALLAVALLQEAETDPVVVVEQPQPLPTVTVDPTTTPVPRSTSLPTTVAAIDVRIGPGEGYAIVGLIGRGEEVEPVGRSDDLEWVAIRFPPGSAALGWLPVSGLGGNLGLDGLSVVFPTPLPRSVSDFPTPTFGPGVGADGTPLPDGTPTPAVAEGPPDLVVTSLSMTPDGRLTAVVANVGEGELSGYAIFVQFRNLGNRAELVRVNIDSLEPGSSIVVTTQDFRLEQAETIQVIVDPLGGIPESNEANNLLQLVLDPQAVAVTPTS